MKRTILAFNGDLESQLALHWLVNQKGYETIALAINLGQEMPMQFLGEQALDLGAVNVHVLDCQSIFVNQFAIPVLQAGAIYQQHCYLGSALARYVIAQELVRLAHDEGCSVVSHAAASKGNDQFRMETAIASLDPDLEVLSPVRDWPFRTLDQKLAYGERYGLDLHNAKASEITVDKNLWGVSLYLHSLPDAWSGIPENSFVLTRQPDQSPPEGITITIGVEDGLPTTLNGNRLELVALIKELSKIGAEHGIGRMEGVEDRLFGLKSREVYEVPAPLLLHTTYRELESLVHTREVRQFKEDLSRKYGELAYSGFWFHDLRYALDGFFQTLSSLVSGEVTIELNRGRAAVRGRRSPKSLFDSELANQANVDWFYNQYAQGFASFWTLSSRLAARQRNNENNRLR